MKNPKRRDKILERSIKLVLFSLISLIMGELFCRYILGLGSPPLSITHPEIEYMFKPNQDVYRFKKRQLYNEFGMRSKNFSKYRSGSEYRVMVFGDSVVNGGNLTSHENLATSLVKKKLEATISNQIIVGNISAGSWGPGNHLAYSQEFGFFDADVIILVISSSDYSDIRKFKPLNPNTHPTQTPILAITEAFQRYLPRYLPIVSTNNRNKQNVDANITDQKLTSEKEITVAMNNLKSFLLETLESNAQVIVLQYLDREEIKNNTRKPGFYAIRDLCNNIDVPVYDTYSDFKNGLSKEMSPFRDKIHPNDFGQKLLGEKLFKIIEDQNLIKTKSN